MVHEVSVMIVRMRDTGRHVVGYDRESGRIVRRKVYEDGAGTEYVRMGRYAMTEPDAHVRKEWFCDHVLMEGMVER